MRHLVPPLQDSALALAVLDLDSEPATIADAEHDTLLYAFAGAGSLGLGGETFELERGSAALVLAGEDATLAGEGLSVVLATVGHVPDRHALLGPRETVVRLDPARTASATGGRSFQILFGPDNGSTRATLFAGFLPPGRAPWHYHLYDEIVWVPEGPGRLHLVGSEDALDAGVAFRLRPRQVHIVENASTDRELTILGFFTPAGSPAAAYLAEDG
jgi:quercetin dioxygenase-like cupin family protein